MRRIFSAVVLAAFPIAAFAATVVPSNVVASASTYDGQNITLTGTVSNFETKKTAIGEYTRFNLCDTKCILVLDKTSQPHTDNTSVTVTGTFHASYKGPHKMWSDVLTIGY